MSTRARHRSLVALAACGLCFAQVVGCGSCVKEDEPQSTPSTGVERKPIDLRAADKRLSQYSTHSVEGGVTDATTD